MFNKKLKERIKLLEYENKILADTLHRHIFENSSENTIPYVPPFEYHRLRVKYIDCDCFHHCYFRPCPTITRQDQGYTIPNAPKEDLGNLSRDDD